MTVTTWPSPEWLSPEKMTSLYGLTLRSVELANPGINVTFRVCASVGEFYLRLYRVKGRTRKQMEGEIDALLTFRPAYEVHVSKPQTLRTGGCIFHCQYQEQPRLACLFTSARGRQPTNTAGDMRQLGAALAVMHRQTAATTCGRSFLPGRVIANSVRHLAQRGPEFRPLCARAQLIGATIEAKLRVHGPLREGFCHGDAWCGNVRFAGPKTTFFDFDDCFDGPLVADLVPQIAWLWHSSRSDFPDLVRIFLDSYASIAGLSNADLMVIPALAQLQEMYSMAFLARYCSLEPVMWAECLARSTRMLDDWSPGGAASSYIAPLTGTARMVRANVA